MTDFYYKGYGIFYLPHPELYGEYEIYRMNEQCEEQDFIGRVSTKKEAREIINNLVKPQEK